MAIININKIIEFLETDKLNVTFSDKGLKYLSLKIGKGEDIIDLGSINKEVSKNSQEYVLVRETWNFLETGSHNMKLDLTDLTSFQQIVLDTVDKIEVGKICSYKKIAEILGKPGAAQAVGTAIVKNPVLYFIPTHRVISKQGLGICKTGAGFLREKLLELEGHDIKKLQNNIICKKNKCCME